MSTPIVTRYPLDPTGVNPNNLVVGEIQTMPVQAIRCIALNNGAFFTQGLVVTDQNTHLPLNPSQYYAGQMYEWPSAQFGLQVCSVIVITDPTVSSSVSVQYQAVGGEFSTTAFAIVQMVNALNLDNRPASWPFIIAKPAAFAPSAHLHAAGDLYGFEYVVAALDRVRSAILLGDGAAMAALYNYVDQQLAVIGSNFATVSTSVGLRTTGYMDESMGTLTATGPATTLDLSLATVFNVTLSANTGFVFETTHLPNNIAGRALGFTVITTNDTTGGWGMAFPQTVMWAGGLIPPRTLTPLGRDEWYFFTLDGGLSWSGSLANQNVKLS